MQKLSQLVLSILLANLIAPSNQLKAATYAFDATDVVTRDPSTFKSSLNAFPAVSISIQDSAVQSGAFSVAYIGSPSNFRGDYASLISFNIGNVIAVTPTSSDGSNFSADLLFSMDGSVSAGAIFYDSANFKIELVGTDASFQGPFASSNSSGQGFVSGTFTAVPEPSSLIVLVSGILGLGWTYRRAG